MEVSQTIRVSKEVIKELKRLGKFGMSYSEVMEKLLAERETRKTKKVKKGKKTNKDIKRKR